MIKFLIDCDPGVDDSIALMYAFHKKDVEIVGIATSFGNVSAAQGADNALRLLKFAGKEGEIPVCVGAEDPLVGEHEPYPAFIHGDNGFGNIELEPSDQKPVDMDVRDFLYEKACEYEGELVLLTLGRLTNIALTLQKYPDFAKKIKRVVIMGGCLGPYGNVGPGLDANVAGDPESVDITLCADWPVLMVGMDVTNKVVLHMSDVKLAKEYCRPECKKYLQFMEDELEHYMKGVRLQNWKRYATPTHDPLAIMVAVNPSLVTTQHRITRIELEGKYTRGMVVTDMREYPIEGNFVEHCIDVDSERALNELFAVFQDPLSSLFE